MGNHAKYVQNHAEICKMMIQAFCEVAACLRRFGDLRKKHLFENPRVQGLGEPGWEGRGNLPTDTGEPGRLK